MKTRIVITKQKLASENSEKEFIVTALYEEDKMLEVNCEKVENTSILGNIYVGKVKNIVKNLNAAFIQIESGVNCYYSMENFHHPIYVKHSGKKELCQGDELVVQIVKEAIKTKDPVVTTNITFSGNYVVLSTENTSIGISNKMTHEEKVHYKKLLEPYKSDEYGFIVRTNARTVSDEVLLLEIQEKVKEYETLRNNAVHRTCFSCLKSAPRQYIQQIRNAYVDELEQIQTDDQEIYDEIKRYLTKLQPDLLEKLSFYEDPMLSLSSLKNVKGNIESALKERVWLKSGAYLIIQPTEALTVIDVNSGKNIARKDPQENFLRINIEAAWEIAYQLRLRNISGICIIDFIDLAAKEAKEELIRRFTEMIRKDPVPVNFVEMTKLGLIEITRKKVRKSLAEQLRG